MTFSSTSRLSAAFLFLAAAVLVPVSSTAAQPVVIKLATLAPEGSTWFKLLAGMGEAWKSATGGAVSLKIYPGGVAGDEEAVIRKIRIGQLQAGAVTGFGLASVDKAFYGLSIPMMFETDEEFAHVRARLAPTLEKRLDDKGLVLLSWSDGGWINFFARKPFSRPSEIKTMKLYVNANDTSLGKIYKETGFQPVPLTLVDILPGLQTDMITAFNATPLAALAFQWFALAPHMCDLRWAPLAGATVIDRKIWLSLPEETRGKLLRASREMGLRLSEEVARLNAEAEGVMVKNGLKIHRVTPQIRDEWRRTAEDAWPRIRGTVVPAEIFDLARKYRDDYRAASPNAGKRTER